MTRIDWDRKKANKEMWERTSHFPEGGLDTLRVEPILEKIESYDNLRVNFTSKGHL